MNRISDLCRLCATSSSNIRHDVLKNSILINSRVVSLEEILYSTVGIKVHMEDGQSTVICDECTNQITNFYVFKNKIEESENQEFSEIELQENEDLNEKETEALNDLLEKVSKFVIKFKIYRLDVIETNRKLEIVRTKTFNCPICSNRFLNGEDFEEHILVCENFVKTAVSDHINDKSEETDMEECIYEDYLELDDYEEKEEAIETEEEEVKPVERKIIEETEPNQFIIIDHVESEEPRVIKEEETSAIEEPESTVGPETLSCPNCEKSFQSQSGLNSHLRLSCSKTVDKRAEEEKLIFTCKNCSATSSTAQQYFKHIGKCTGRNLDKKLQKLVLNCPNELCEAEFEDLRLLRQHALTCCPTSIVAKKFFRGKYNIKKKEPSTSAGNSKKTSYCEFCTKRFDNEFMRENHFEIHKAFDFLNSRNYLKFNECENCHSIFHSTEDLEKHSNGSTCDSTSKTIECGYCSTTFPDQDIKTLREHIFFRHWNIFVCPIESCKVDLKTPRYFYFHIQMRHPDFLEIQTEFKCQYCGNLFENYPVLSAHRKKDCTAKNFQCHHCDKVYGSQALLNSHIFKINNPFICTLCEKSCKDSSQLKIHMRTHTKERPYKCNIANCNASFTTPGLRAAHADNHNSKKNFQCPVPHCAKIFQTKTNLTSHMKNHTGAVHCEVCGNLYSSKKSLECHMRSHKNNKNNKK